MYHMNGATSNVDKFFQKGKELLKEDLKKKIFWQKKEKTGNVQLGYIDDIHVIGIFIAC